MLDREKLKKLGIKVVEPEDEKTAVVHFFSNAAIRAVRIWEKLETSQYLDQSMLFRPRAGDLI